MRALSIATLLSCIAIGASGSMAASTEWPIDGRFDVGGRSIRLSCGGAGGPAVVIDAGMGTAPVEDAGWRAIAAQVEPVTRVCLYDRAGLGRSDPAAPGPRSSLDAARDLHAALGTAGVTGPYLLVGHSVGGLHAQVFAARYPADTAGLVLVSTTHPDQFSTWLALLPPSAPGEEPAITEARSFLVAMQTDPGKNEERLDMHASAVQARQLTSLGNKPVIVLTHSPRFRMVPGLSEPIAVRLEDATQRMQRQFLSLSTNARQNVADRAGHGLPHEAPAFVVEGILQGVAAVRERPRS
ncbi:pimeloyl-ACP methyl ester carboxylesterase [Sphingomonas jejuensis]|uniref:Pimeloyl-ACP methyl ester carboxylesterase n=1 Tax=Sphingomonas jejuensis TaxID=904715 RepID=A0ABX0XGV4_9SPHN|nr:alpha/beta hydrolase [Sphingomonas jejuensis]NJC32553.1 pimeloyl-ACP methyl ester carboxylesterase [Sphingomonas jejuensis]